jgi:hypothetical protein
MGACYARAHPRPAPASRRCNIPCSPKSTAWLLHFFVLCVVASLGDTFYWSTYHAYFAALGNHEIRLKLFLADGWIGAGYHFVWQIALFLSLGESFVAYGGALALAALVGAVAGLVLGRHIDAGHAAQCPMQSACSS